MTRLALSEQPDPACKCSHPYSDHDTNGGWCEDAHEIDSRWSRTGSVTVRCSCEIFSLEDAR